MIISQICLLIHLAYVKCKKQFLFLIYCTREGKGAKNINTAKVKREFNIAGNGNIDNKDTYFSWSSAQSTVTTISNQSYKVTSSNSTLQPIKFVQPSWNHSHVGKGRTSYTSGGFIYDRA